MPCSSRRDDPAGQMKRSLPRRGLLRLATPALTPPDVARYMGLPGKVEPDSEVARTIHSAMTMVLPVVRPLAVWGRPDLLAAERDHLLVAYPGGKPVSITGKGPLFAGADSVLFSLVTLGADLDKYMAALYAGDDLLLAMAADAVASAAMSAIGKRFRALRRAALARQCLQMGAAYSPGCQALPLTAQQAVFAVLQPERAGISLSDDCQITPAKSATTVAPVGAALPAWMLSLDPCQICNLQATCKFQEARG